MIPPPHRQTKGGNHCAKKSESSGRSRLQRFISMGGSCAPFSLVQWRAFVALYLETTLSVFSPRYRLAVPREKRSNGRSFSIENKSLRVHVSRSPNSSSPYSREGTALPCGFTRFSIFLFFPFFIRQLRKIEPRNPDCSKSLKTILQY